MFYLNPKNHHTDKTANNIIRKNVKWEVLELDLLLGIAIILAGWFGPSQQQVVLTLPSVTRLRGNSKDEHKKLYI